VVKQTSELDPEDKAAIYLQQNEIKNYIKHVFKAIGKLKSFLHVNLDEKKDAEHQPKKEFLIDRESTINAYQRD
jgi:hypothetical protein